MAGLHSMLETYVDNRSLPGAVGLMARGRLAEVAVVGSAALDGAAMARDSIFRLASVTKPITAAAVMAGSPATTGAARAARCCLPTVPTGSGAPGQRSR